jgi:hypothetical protein
MDKDRDEDGNQPCIPFDIDLGSDDDDIWDLEGNHSTATLAVVQSALEGSLESTDLYIDEAMEANFANGYFELTPDILPSLFDGLNVTDDPSGNQLFTAMDTIVTAQKGNERRRGRRGEECLDSGYGRRYARCLFDRVRHFLHGPRFQFKQGAGPRFQDN